jgi:integrase
MTKRERKPARKPVNMTDPWVRNYKTPGLSPADTKSGVHLYVGKTGRKSWVRYYRHPISKKLIKMTLRFPIGLAQIRKRIADDNDLLSRNIDPVERDRADKRAKLEAAEGTLNNVAKQYVEVVASKLRSRRYYENSLKKHVLPILGERPIAEIKRSEIAKVLDGVKGRFAADATKRVLNALMNWYMDRDDDFKNPMRKMKARLKPNERMRERVLDDGELRAVWNAAGDERVGTYGQVIRLLILTGARREEVAGLPRDEIKDVRDGGQLFTVWTLPRNPRGKGRNKPGREIIRPLSKAAIDIIEKGTPRIGDDYVFTLNGIRPVSMHHAKKLLLDEIAGVKNWRVHDLRRVFRSACTNCGVPDEIAERCIGHTRPVPMRTYDRALPLAAMQKAVDNVAKAVARIVADEREDEHEAEIVYLR